MTRLITRNPFFFSYSVSPEIHWTQNSFNVMLSVKVKGVSNSPDLVKVNEDMVIFRSVTVDTGMRKFRIDQDFLIEHWHMIYIMSVVFAEIYV